MELDQDLLHCWASVLTVLNNNSCCEIGFRSVFCAGSLFSVHAASLDYETYDYSRYVYLKRNKLYFL